MYRATAACCASGAQLLAAVGLACAELVNWVLAGHSSWMRTSRSHRVAGCFTHAACSLPVT